MDGKPDGWLPRNRFYMVQSNVGPSILEFTAILNARWLSIWRPGGVVVIDESLWEFLGQSPNHITIQRKPHKNGHLAYQLAGYTGTIQMPMVYCLSPYVFGNKLAPRLQARKLMEMFLPKDQTVHLVCDSAFGSFEEALHFQSLGVCVTYSMNVTPKNYLWDLLAFECPSESGRVAVVPLGDYGQPAVVSYYRAVDDKGDIHDLRTLTTSFSWSIESGNEYQVTAVQRSRVLDDGTREYETLYSDGKVLWQPVSIFMDEDGTFTTQFLAFAQADDIQAALEGLTVPELEVICEAQNFSVRYSLPPLSF